MEALLTDEDCKTIIKRLSRKLCARAELIATRLLSEDDKNDMREGNLSIEALEAHIKVWIENGMPDYAHGKTEPYAIEQKRIKTEKPFKKNDEPQKLKLNKPFVEHRVLD